MVSETKVGQLVINLQMKTKSLEQGLETAKKKIQEMEEQNRNMQVSNNNLEGTFIALSVTAVASISKIIGIVKECTEAYNEYNNANVGLKSILDGQGKSYSKAQGFIEEYISDGLVPLNNAVTAYKNLALRGYNNEQIKQTMINLKNAAAFGRQSTLEYGYAIQSATEGLKNFNPVLVDNAGVTKNMSVMYDEYAKKIGKTAASLTEEEKILAEVNGITEETKFQTNDATKYAETYSGQQAKLNAELLSTKQTIGESLIPVLTELTSIINGVVSGIKNMVDNNKAGTVGLITFTTTLLGAGIAVGGVVKAISVYKAAAIAANMTTKAFTLSLLANPLFMGTIAFAAIVAGISEIATKQKEQEEAQAKLNEVTERYNQIKAGTYRYDNQGIQQLETDKQVIQEQIKLLQQINEKNEKIKEMGNNPINPNFTGFNDLKKELKELKKQYEENIKTNGKFGNSIDELNKKLKENEQGLKEANAIQDIKKAIDIETVKSQQKEAAQLRINAEQMQRYLDIVKKGQKSTTEYQDAVQALAKAYPEAANSEGILIELAQDYINTAQAKAEKDWNASQTAIKGNIDVINKYKEMVDAAKSNEIAQKQLAESIGIAYENIMPTLTSTLNILNMMSNVAPATVAGTSPVTGYKKTSSSKSGSSYQNKALDNYKKQIEHKKALDQISLRDEINMYQTALNKYAKTTDEKMELEKKLYELRKELTDKTLDDCTAQIDYEVNMGYISTQQELARYEQAYNMYAKTFEQKRELEVKIRDLRVQVQEEIMQKMKEEADKEREMLNRKTEDYKNYIEEQKNLRGAEYDVKKQEADLNKIIEMHRNYLNQIMRDERYSLEERESIYREELNIIKDYEQQKRDARISSVNSTLSQLKSAITKQIEEMEQADEEAIKKNLELVEEWKNTRIDAINAEYDAKIEAIQKELDALDKAEQQKSRDEEDAEYEKKKKRLEELAQYEHDATTKANYLKELAKLEEEYQKTLDKRILDDKKEALKEQQELLKEEQSNKVDKIQEEAEKQKEQYEKQLDSLKEYYDKQKEMAEETAQKMLLNVEQNQSQILNLLTKYGDKYEITGQTLGEKLAQGINNGLADKIQNIIQTVQNRIDEAIENQISKWTSAAYKYEQATAKSQTKTVQTNVTQNNYIQQNPEMPSETYRKLNNVSRNLASELAGV